MSRITRVVIVCVIILLVAYVSLVLRPQPKPSIELGFWFMPEVPQELLTWVDRAASHGSGQYVVRSGEAQGLEWFYLYLPGANFHVNPIPQNRAVKIGLDESPEILIPVIFYIKSINKAVEHIHLESQGTSISIIVSNIPTLEDTRLLRIDSK